MNLRDLQYVVTLSEQRHFGRAAALCGVSQPTLSGQIAKLEEELGIAVFHRVGRSVRPTPAGEEIISHARRAVAAAEAITEVARSSRDPLSGRLRLGVIPTLGPYLMPFVLPVAAAKLPNAPLVIIEDLTGNLMPLVAQGRLDAAIIASPPELPEIASMELFDEPFWVATPANHPLLGLKTVSPSDIDPKSLLLLSDGHCLRDQILELCHQQQASLPGDADIRATSLETLLHLTGAGFGVTLVPQMAVDCGRVAGNSIAIRPLAGNAVRGIRLIYRRASPRMKALVELARLIRAALPEPIRKSQR
ncbi:MAG: hydrogen peroxide-inducible genes activator [Alphaproteobacteria bacterium]|nr:hydrogen peroxide-inducible genes activator [Alphaproteobacteria bacterium]